MVMMNDVVDLMAAVIGLRWRFDLTWRMVVFVVFSLSNALGAFRFILGLMRRCHRYMVLSCRTGGHKHTSAR
jgi:hypothetical protein